MNYLECRWNNPMWKNVKENEDSYVSVLKSFYPTAKIESRFQYSICIIPKLYWEHFSILHKWVKFAYKWTSVFYKKDISQASNICRPYPLVNSKKKYMLNMLFFFTFLFPSRPIMSGQFQCGSWVKWQAKWEQI